MLTTLILAALLLWLAGAVLTVVFLCRAPEGFEDETGFHRIVEPEGAGRELVRLPLREAKEIFG